MGQILDWVKNYILVFFFMMVLLSLVSKKEYKSYIRFFMEMVLVVTLASPLLGLFGKSEEFLERIEYDRFWQELKGIQADEKKMNFINEEYYISYYEEMVEKDVSDFVGQDGYDVLKAKVAMDESYQITGIELDVVKKEEGQPVVIGKVLGEEADTDILELQKKVADYYQIQEGAVEVRN